jgi:quercetin dioxygenase-like cupin family protein
MFIDTNTLSVWERLPGWRGRFFRSEKMTFSCYDFEAGSSVHEHHHPTEEIWYVVEGELEITVDGKTQIAGPGVAAIVPFDVPHSVRARTDGRAVIVDHPARADVPAMPR